MKTRCITCRWYQIYRCLNLTPHCRFNCVEFANKGKKCPKYQERIDG